MKPNNPCLPLLAALGLALPVPAIAAPATAGKSTRRTNARPRVKRSARPHRPSATRRVPRKEGTAMLTAALLNYADGKRRNATERNLAKALDALPHGRATAKRLAKRIRAQPASVRKHRLGAFETVLTKPTSGKSLLNDAKKAPGTMDPFVDYDDPAKVLPPEGKKPPYQVSFELAGVQCESAQDADGSDELVVITKLYTLGGIGSGNADTLAAVDIDLAAGAAAEASATAQRKREDPLFIVSGLAEADGSRLQTEQDLEVAIELARVFAVQTDPENKDTAFAASLEYTAGTLALSNPSTAPSLVGTKLPGLTTWWAEDPGTSHGIEFKGSIDHTLPGGGQYAVLYDVPHTYAPGRWVGVRATNAKLIDPHAHPEKIFSGFRVVLGIQGELAESPTQSIVDTLDGLHVRRRVEPGTVELQLLAKIDSRFRRRYIRDEGGWCGDPGFTPPPGAANKPYLGKCKTSTETISAGKLTYSPTSNLLVDYSGGQSHTYDGANDSIAISRKRFELELNVYDDVK